MASSLSFSTKRSPTDQRLGMEWKQDNRLRGPPSLVYASAGRSLKRVSTTLSSAIVETSPRSRSPMAILRKTRLMILPERVLGSPGASCMKSGVANGPIFFRTE